MGQQESGGECEGILAAVPCAQTRLPLPCPLFPWWLQEGRAFGHEHRGALLSLPLPDEHPGLLAARTLMPICSRGALPAHKLSDNLAGAKRAWISIGGLDMLQKNLFCMASLMANGAGPGCVHMAQSCRLTPDWHCPQYRSTKAESSPLLQAKRQCPECSRSA